MKRSTLANDARSIWNAAVAAVRPAELMARFVERERAFRKAIERAERILVVGAGKAGAAMAEALEDVLGPNLARTKGMINVPENAVRPLRQLRLHGARPAASNYPTAEGVTGSNEMLDLMRSAGPNDLGICLISGGGSALLPAPDGVTLAEKLAITKLLHVSGATIDEMNCVRKHLSAIKGGRLAQAFRGRELVSLIISDVVGDPLDVIASGPTCVDPSTFADAMAVLDKFGLMASAPAAVVQRLRDGVAGKLPETLKALPGNVRNEVLANNATALRAAEAQASQLGYQVLNLGSYVEGETAPVAVAMTGIMRSVRDQQIPIGAPACILSGGETTVTLGERPGMGGRNQEFVLSAMSKLGPIGMRGVAILSGGTDGEDGPTDAAGAMADEATWAKATAQNLRPTEYLARHDAYRFFDAVGGLIRTGLTDTNVMDVRVMLVGDESA